MPSLTGRRFVDRMKRAVGGYLRFPVPPYDSPRYWDGAYRSVGPRDVFEWGELHCSQHLLKYRYKLLLHHQHTTTTTTASSSIKNDHHQRADVAQQQDETVYTSTLGETLLVHPEEEKGEISSNNGREEDDNDDDDSTEEKPLLMLGCGTSKMGEDMLDAGWRGPMIQLDVSANVVNAMRRRITERGVYTSSRQMQVVQDDATELSAINDNAIWAVIDKGMVDAIFCADAHQSCYDVLDSVHRVLKPGGVFMCLSYSYPEFVLDKLLYPPPRTDPATGKKVTFVGGSYADGRGEQKWRDTQVRELECGVLLYRFQKMTKWEPPFPGVVQIGGSKQKRQAKHNNRKRRQ